ncbi:unnamed protein product, partial [Polarella glacialis]
ASIMVQARSPPKNNRESQMPDMLQGRYKISLGQVLGEGAYAKVYRGLDTHSNKNVAVKVYKDHSESSMAAFQKCVEVSRTLGSLRPIESVGMSRQISGESTQSLDNTEWESPYWKQNQSEASGMFSARSWNPAILTKQVSSLGNIGDRRSLSLLGRLDVSGCFVSLLEFSSCNGMPGVDAESDALFLVFEEGGESLHDKLKRNSNEGRTLSTSELRHLQWALVTIVYGLHSKGLVHLDIKPPNIVCFKGANGVVKWKLIDLDGCMPTGTRVPLEDIAFSMVYASPELASARLGVINNGVASARLGARAQTLELSRLMDVWSIGMTAMEAIFFTPVLGPWYSEWLSETGSEDKFLNWLADTKTEAVISGDMREALAGIDPDMCDMLRRMLEKDKSKRASINECLAHPWFEPIRQEFLEEVIDEEPPCNTVNEDVVGDKAPGLKCVYLPQKILDALSKEPAPAAAAPTSPSPQAEECPEPKMKRSPSYERAASMRKNISSKACVVM